MYGYSMTIDFRTETEDFRNYLAQRIKEHLAARGPSPTLVHVGFTFDQAGWIIVYFDTRPNAIRDGEWTTHIDTQLLLERPHWYEGSEFQNLGDMHLLDCEGNELQSWSANPSLQEFANILGDFLRTSVMKFESENLFQPLIDSRRLEFCVEEFTGLYGWPVDPEIAKLVESLKFSGQDSSSHIV